MNDSDATQTDPAPLIESARQRTIRRNWRFNLLPGLILAFSLASLVWEIIRDNVGSTDWPWSLQLLTVNTAASISSMFGALMLARAQYARSVRPSLSWVAQPAKSTYATKSCWSVYLLNAGPGLANVAKITYLVEVKTPDSAMLSREGSRFDVIQPLESVGLRQGIDFFLELLTSDAPLPVVKSPKEGLELAAFSAEALKKIRRLDITLRVVDIVGDEHEKRLPLMAAVPENLLGTRSIDDLLKLPIEGPSIKNYPQGERQ